MNEQTLLSILNENNNFRILDENFKTNYTKLYFTYNILLMNYIYKNWGITRYDDYFKNSLNQYKKIIEENMDFYQSRSFEFFDYYFIRNDLHIERLNEEEKKFLLNRCTNKNIELDKESEEFIEKTLKKIVLEDENDTSLILYGEDNAKFLKPKNSIIIGFRYDSKIYDITPEEWEILNQKRKSEIYLFNQALEKELTSKLKLNVSVIEYNDFNIKKRTLE